MAEPGAINDAGGILPDFCAIRSVFAVVVSAELLSFLLVLAQLPGPVGWEELGLVSLFVQWVALSCAALLCLLRSTLVRRTPAVEVAVGFALVLLVTAAYSLAALELLPTVILSSGERRWLFLGRNLAIAGILGALLLRYLYMQDEWRRQLQAEARARIQALQARIRPHFLFNSLNTIASLTRSDAERAESALEDLAELFRASLRGAVTEVPLSEELELCHRYLEMESLRLGGRLQVQWALEEVPESTPVPLLSLQPLLENAVYHGIEPRAEGGCVEIEGQVAGGRICLEVRNPLPPAGAAPHRNGNRLAHRNIHERLQALYGRTAGLEAGERDGVYEVRLCWPLAGGRGA